MASLFGRSALAERARQIGTDTVREHIALVQTWLDDYDHGTLKGDKETAREQQYNQDFFIRILGYREKPATPYTFEPKHTTLVGQYPDAVLRYTDAAKEIDNVSAVVELKGASVSLDKPQQREGNLSPVQQAFKYKPQYASCPFVVVSNFWEFRLYNDNQLDYEVWTLRDLVDPEDDYLKFKKWYVLLHADNMVAARGKSATEALLSDIRQRQEDIGKQFYADYKKARLALLEEIWDKNKARCTTFDVAVQKTQTIIDRIVFSCFAEDSGLLPDDTLARVAKNAQSSPYNDSLWDELKDFFTKVDKGSSKLGIPQGYNGGLFAADPLIDGLTISDGPLEELIAFGGYNFSEDLRVNILGHIFEQSISDLEEIKRRKAADSPASAIKQEKAVAGKRKKEGVYYTPDYIVRYIVQNTVGTYLREKEEELKVKHRLTGRLGERGYELRQTQAYTEYQYALQNIKVLDPACGSGAFLVAVFDYLLAENKRVDDILGGSLTSQDQFVRSILSDNIFGVDINPESVEITKLSLWLKTAEKGKKLTALDNSIRCGNSLISNSTIAANAFDWHDQFSEITSKGGFDVVVGNPPYVSAIEMKKSLPEGERKEMKKQYVTARGAVDLYIYFFELGVKLLKPNGILGYITPNRYLSVSYGAGLREWIVDNYRLESMLNCSDTRVFEDASTYPVITTIRKQAPNTHYMVAAGHLDEQTPVPHAVGHDSSKLSTLPEYIIGFLLNDKLPIAEKVFLQSAMLSEVGSINATSTAGEADEYGDYISEVPGHRIINTGTIDPYLSMWGRSVFTKQGKRFLKPFLDLSEVSNSRSALYTSPKIILAKIALRAEAFYDSNGDYASIDTNCIHSFKDDYKPEYVLCWLNSRLYNYVFECLFDGARMSGGYMGYSAPNLRCTPIKALSLEDQQPFVDIAQELSTLHEEKAQADHRFRAIIRHSVAIESWPGVNNEWWAQDVNDFIRGFKKRFKTDEVEDLMNAHGKHAPNVAKIDARISLLNRKADKLFYAEYGLTRAEISKVEEMVFAV
ncbi:N-6 DNA methylase [Rhodococcus pyridinivorans]|uniref:Eco57I restriction-modification methylase domain-containing protein n=1 Tax=Rhodococcus pyridinivorans TaxID=103816 RepID=UPI00280B208E|nr:N-6 DNA methylase [Rhodococcus pyridinivorans]WMM74454.1 N-6 DNA methylase [Rhodococcus pyridinivorans]